MTLDAQPDALIVGAGPAGLMAADRLGSDGFRVLVVDAKPSPARKFLMAGKSGLNITRDEPLDAFVARYGEAAEWLGPMIARFGPADIVDWMQGLGQSAFVGSTGRVFPTAMKASPLLRAWLARLDRFGVQRRMRWRWTGFAGDAHGFDTPGGTVTVHPRVTILAMGGASWARLGSDGAWTTALANHGVPLAPFRPANVGVVKHWSSHMAPVLGQAVKGVILRAGSLTSRGEIILSQRGIEGGGIYTLSPALRDGAALIVDLFPDLSLAQVEQRLARRPVKESVSNTLKKALNLSGARLALVLECARPFPADPGQRAALLKALTIPHDGPRPMDEAISTAGGIPSAALTGELSLRGHPGVFAAGEMLDWEAPTGGYLLTACLATGLHAGASAVRYLHGDPAQDKAL